MAAIPVVDIPDPSLLSDSQLVRHIFASVNRMESTLSAQQQKIEKLEGEVNTLNKKVFQLENLVNQREQELRGLTVRIAGLPFTDEEKSANDGKFLAKKTYERILQPLLTQAKASKFIDKIPGLANTISECYCLRSNSALTGTASPPPILVKLASDQVRLASDQVGLAILCSKWLHMPKPNPTERDMGITSFFISEDLMPPTYAKLKSLRRLEEVTKAWTINGRIKFIRSGSQAVHTVRSVFETDEAILSKATR